MQRRQPRGLLQGVCCWFCAGERQQRGEGLRGEGVGDALGRSVSWFDGGVDGVEWNITVSRPSEMVPTNLLRVMIDGIAAADR